MNRHNMHVDEDVEIRTGWMADDYCSHARNANYIEWKNCEHTYVVVYWGFPHRLHYTTYASQLLTNK